MTTFRIIGQVIDSQTDKGVSGIQVEAWDKDLICDDLVGSAITDKQGAFQIEFDESYFKELFLDRKPDLFFKVFYKGELIKSTEDSILWNIENQNTQITIPIQKGDIKMPNCDEAQNKLDKLNDELDRIEKGCYQIGNRDKAEQCVTDAYVEYLPKINEARRDVRHCEAELPPVGPQETQGRVTFLRVSDGKDDLLKREVTFKLDTQLGRVFGFQLQDNYPVREGMLSLLRDSLLNNLDVIIKYQQVINQPNSFVSSISLIERQGVTSVFENLAINS